jgi:hypothetical protein
MFIIGEIVKPSGVGRTATWENICGTVTSVGDRSVIVQWHNIAVDEELDCEEVVSTHRFTSQIPHHARVLDGTEDGTLITFYDDDEKSSS